LCDNYAAITVAAMADVNELGFGLASFSSRGPTRDNRMKPDISAPGVKITAPRANSTNGYVEFSGTSMATPFVSGSAALMLDANPALTVDQVKQILRETAQDWGPPGQDVDYGWGRLDTWAAVKRAGSFSGGTAPVVPSQQVITGRFTASGGTAEHLVNVTAAAYPISVTMIMPGWTGSSSPDFDLYIYNPDGTELGRATGTTRQEQVAKAITRTGSYKIAVRAYAGTGDYILDVSAGMGAPADAPPTVAVDQPAEGATVSGTVAVKVRASDDVRVAKVEAAVDGGAWADMTASFDGTFYTYPWDTTAVTDGAHTVTARATDSAGQQSQAARHVTVANGAPPPGPGPQHEVTRTGRVTAAARDMTVAFTVLERGTADLSLAWPTTADLDFYVYAPDGSFIGRAYTTNKPERFTVDTVRYGLGTYHVRVNLYSGSDSDFTLTAAGSRVETLTGSVSATARDSNQTRAVNFTGPGRVILSWPTGSDLDVFVSDPSGRERARGYTLRNPEDVSFTWDSAGTWRIRVNLYSGAGTTYTLRLYVPEAVLS
jgi:hypothetical protein